MPKCSFKAVSCKIRSGVIKCFRFERSTVTRSKSDRKLLENDVKLHESLQSIMKSIIIGTSLSGKTTLVRYLRDNTKLPVLEIDEELTRLNNGQYPTDNKLKHAVLAPQVVKDVLGRDNIVFFTNTDYFALDDLEAAREKGFKIIQLSLDLEELNKRNKFRVENEGYSDLGKWFGCMIEYQKTIKDKGLVDKIVDAKQTTEKVVEDLLQFLT